MLLTGTPGSGRSRLAFEIAALVNNTTADAAATHPDIHKLEPFFSTSFRAGATKVGIILDADRLHLNAANAFLKTLEEPPAHTLFILVTSNPGLLPVTIVSRCAHFALRTAQLPDLAGPAAEVAAATGALLDAPERHRLGAALRLARRLQSVLRDARETVQDEVSAAFKAEKKRLGDTAEDEWIKDEETRLKALVEARVLATRQHLVGVVAERAADVLRARHGVQALQFPALATESQRLAAQFDDAALLRVLDGAARLRLFLDRNVKEDIALEAGCLALARP